MQRLWLILILAPLQAAAMQTIDSFVQVPIVPGGEWFLPEQTFIDLNPDTHRLLTVVRSGNRDPGFHYKVLNFDGSTKALASSIDLPVEQNRRPLCLGVSSASNTLFISWKDIDRQFNTNRSSPSGTLVLDLNTRQIQAGSDNDRRLHVFDIDLSNNRLLGIAEPVPPATTYVFLKADLSTDTWTAKPIPFATQENFIDSVVYDPTRDRLDCLFTPSRDNDPRFKKRFGFVVALDAETGDEIVRSPTLEGEFIPYALKLSPASSLLAAIPLSANSRKIYILNAETLEIDTTLEEETQISSTFFSAGTGVWIDDCTLWIANRLALNGDQSIAAYDLCDATLEGFIRDATTTQELLLDRDLDSVWAASTDLDSLFVISATSTLASTQIEISIIPDDLEVDPTQGVYQLLSQGGGMYLFSESEEILLSRKPGQGANPADGLISDPQRNRLFVSGSPERNPKILEANAYDPIGEVPFPAAAMMLDASRNLLYVLHLPQGATHGLVQELDGETLQTLRTFAEFDQPSSPNPAGFFLQVDTVSRSLWVLAIDGVGGDLTRIDLVTQATSSIHLNGIPFTMDALGGEDSVVIGLLSFDTFDLKIRGISFDEGNLVEDYSLPSGAVSFSDSISDPDSGYLHFLAVFSGDPFFRILVFDPDSQSILDTLGLPFLNGSSQARFTLNPQTQEFAVASAPDSNLYLFGNPIAPGTKEATKGSPFSFTGSFTPTSGALRIDWNFSPAAGTQVLGFVLERREQVPPDRLPQSGWIRLNPFPLPFDSTSWTDTTVRDGVTYFYRLRAQVLGPAAPEPLLLGPVGFERPPGWWSADIPEVALSLPPGATASLTLFVQGEETTLEPLAIGSTCEAGISLQTDPPSVPRPSTARIALQVEPGASPGVYLAQIRVADDTDEIAVPLLVRVIAPSQRIDAPTISREPTVIQLTSDSDLDQRVLSVRGQLGLQRRLARPRGLRMEALLPTGEILAATGILAPTGEFTADFVVPATLADGDWAFRATFPGSFEAVGGSSSLFKIPVYTNGAETKGLTEEDFDLGRIVIAQGAAPPGNPPNGMEETSEQLKQTLFENRFKRNDADVRAATGLAALTEGLQKGAEESDRFLLLYLFGDAARKGSHGIEFLFPDGSRVAQDQLYDLIDSIKDSVTPLVVLDCPDSARFAGLLQGFDSGAYIYSSREGWPPIANSFFFGADEFSFTRYYNRAINGQLDTGHSGFGAAYQSVAVRFLPIGALIEGQSPSDHRATLPEFLNLQVGSHFTPPRSLIRDRIPPTILGALPSGDASVGTSLPLEVLTSDTPFGLGVRVAALVLHPSGVQETIRLQSDSSGHLHQGFVTVRESGLTSLELVATDSQGNIAARATSILGQDECADRESCAEWLMWTLENARTGILGNGSPRGLPEEFFDFAQRWGRGAD